MIVIDTNIVLDAFVFDDSGSEALKAALAGGRIEWLATQPMRDELERVLAYPLIVKRLLRQQRSAAEVLALFDAQARLVDVAARANVRCRDPDDQKFVDLAVAHKTVLLSKDRALLCLSKRLLPHGVRAQAIYPSSP
jgi:putative PIN family toxin of toxin-antitoxin system